MYDGLCLCSPSGGEMALVVSLDSADQGLSPSSNTNAGHPQPLVFCSAAAARLSLLQSQEIPNPSLLRFTSLRQLPRAPLLTTLTPRGSLGKLCSPSWFLRLPSRNLCSVFVVLEFSTTMQNWCLLFTQKLKFQEGK